MNEHKNNRPQRIFYEPKGKTSFEMVEKLIDAAIEIEPEFAIEINMAYGAGVPLYVTRRLELSALCGNKLTIRMPRSKCAIVRTISDSLVKLFSKQDQYQKLLCPKLKEMPDQRYFHKWSRIMEAVDKKVSAASLLSNYRRTHRVEMKLEMIMGRLIWLAMKWLTENEIKELQRKVEVWKCLPPLKKRNKRRTQAQILGREAK